MRAKTRPVFLPTQAMEAQQAQSSHMDAILRRLAALEAQNATLQQQNAALQAQIDSLHASRMELVDANLRLRETIDGVKSAVAALSDRYDRDPELFRWLAERRRMSLQGRWRGTPCRAFVR